jgi:hypothetical protein
MVGVTLAFGGVVTAMAVSELDASASGNSLASYVQQASVGKQVSLIYGAVVAGSGSCTATYEGPDGNSYVEGKTYVLVLFDYGGVTFSPYEVFDNNTMLSVGGYSAITAGSPGQGASPVSNTLTLTSCAHPAGQTFLLVDTSGDEVTVGT